VETHQAAETAGEQIVDEEGVPMENETDTVGGYAVPMDPMDLLQCDSCQ
jgi:hypothetical protein